MELIGLLMITNQFGHSMTKKMESIWKFIFQGTTVILMKIILLLMPNLNIKQK